MSPRGGGGRISYEFINIGFVGKSSPCRTCGGGNSGGLAVVLMAGGRTNVSELRWSKNVYGFSEEKSFFVFSSFFGYQVTRTHTRAHTYMLFA